MMMTMVTAMAMTMMMTMLPMMAMTMMLLLLLMVMMWILQWQRRVCNERRERGGPY